MRRTGLLTGVLLVIGVTAMAASIGVTVSPVQPKIVVRETSVNVQPAQNGGHVVTNQVTTVTATVTVPGTQGIPGRNGVDGVNGIDGVNGTNGVDGQPGAPGPNQVSTTTATDITGLLKGNGATVQAATPGTDYLEPTGSGAGLTGITAAQTGSVGIPAFNIYTSLGGGRIVNNDPRLSDARTPTAHATTHATTGNDPLSLAALGATETCTNRIAWDGVDGAAGSKILTGTGVPSSGTGVDTDYYMDTATGNYYTKAGGSWTLQGNLVGPPNTLSIGTVTAVAYPGPASATITGDAPDQTLNLVTVVGPAGDSNVTRAYITEHLAEASDTTIYIRPATDGLWVGGVVLQDYYSRTAVVLLPGRVEFRDTGGSLYATLDQTTKSLTTYTTVGEPVARLDGTGIYGLYPSGAIGFSWKPSTGNLVLQ
jgi:hypothetical protein